MQLSDLSVLPTGVSAIARLPLVAAPGEDLLAALPHLSQAIAIITSLRILQDFDDPFMASAGIKQPALSAAANAVRAAAALVSNTDLAAVLEARAASLELPDTKGAALVHANAGKLPLHLVIGAIPSWRFEGHPKFYSALLATDATGAISPQAIDKAASDFFEKFTQSACLPEWHKRAPLPVYDICDLVLCGGDALCHPIHVATFIPDDEGVWSHPKRRSIVYRNLYASRHIAVSSKLAACMSYAPLAPTSPDEIISENALLIWLRGHDWGHTIFDPICRRIGSLPKHIRYSLQECLADIYGLLFLLGHFTSICPKITSANTSDVFRVYWAELLRYAKRNRELFPDTLSAWMQLDYLQHCGAISISHEGIVGGNIDDMINSLKSLFSELLALALSADVARLMQIAHRCLADPPKPLHHFLSRIYHEPDALLIPALLDPIFPNFQKSTDQGKILRTRQYNNEDNAAWSRQY